jgi:hypothetical protein
MEGLRRHGYILYIASGRPVSDVTRSDTQAIPRQSFFQSFVQAPGRARIHSFQLPEDFLQRLFGLRAVIRE